MTASTPYFFSPVFSWPAAPGGKLHVYQSGGTTPATSYAEDGVTPNSNPVTLDSNGTAVVRLANATTAYHVVLKDSTDTTTLWDADTYQSSYLLASGSVDSSIITYDQTAAEIAASVTPANTAYLPGIRARYGSLADCIAVSATHEAVISASESISTVVTLPSGAMIKGVDRPTITQTSAGVAVFAGASLTGVTISGLNFVGLNTTTVPGTGYGGFAAANTGLVTVANSTDVRIKDCGVSTFYNGLTVQGCTRVWIENNQITTFLTFGILGSQSKYVFIDDNDIENCTQAGAVVAYGIHATGDAAGGNPCTDISITNNRINGIPSWDAIGTHDCDGLVIVGNKCRNVRHGIDVGHLVSTNVVNNILIAHNYIEGCTVDTWSGAAAEIGAILVEGFDATHRVQGATITGNIIRGFFNVSGMVGGGDGAGCICVAHTDDANVTGNIVANCGTLSGGSVIPQSTGMFFTGTCNRLTIVGNSIQAGALNRGGIRANALTFDVLTIVGNSGIYTTTSTNHVEVLSSTGGVLNVNSNPTNSTLPYTESSTTTTVTSNATLAGSGNTATAVTNSSTIPTAFGLVRCTAAGATTGNILTAGIAPGQECVIINNSGSNSITMAASGTSNVADGVSCVIAANSYKRFIWNADTSLWYHN